MFETLREVGEGILIPLQKPGKPRGPCSSLRPVTLLNSIRKAFSLVVLGRFREEADDYIPCSQSAYRRGHSTADIVFAKRIQCDTVINKVFEFHMLGIDLSRAFDTVDRKRLLEVTSRITSSNDVCRMVHALLDNTTLQVRVGKSLADQFKATVGTPWGDRFSPVAFNGYYEASLQELRAQAPPRPSEDDHTGLPPETQYADDLDFLSTAADHLERLHDQALETLPTWNLKANAEKTERVHVHVADSLQRRDKEDWRRSKTLGSFLGVEEDVSNRISEAAAVMKKLWGLWGGTSCLPRGETQSFQRSRAACLAAQLRHVGAQQST